MSRSGFSPDVVEALTRARGRLHVIDQLEPAKTALVVIDMQNFFVEQGQALEVPAARGVCANINQLASAARRRGAAVVWVQMTMNPEDLRGWDVFLTVNGGKADYGGLGEREHGHRLWPELDVREGDLIVQKKRFSAFIQGSSDLDEILREKGIDTLVIAGTLTNICCESTARDAMMLNYRVLMAADANAALTPEAHEAALLNMIGVFGDVRSTDEVIALLEEGSVSRRAG